MVEQIITKVLQEDYKKSEDLTENKKQNKFDKVMGEFEKGELKSSNGKKVTDKKQALAIAYSESGLNEGVGGEGKKFLVTDMSGRGTKPVVLGLKHIKQNWDLTEEDWDTEETLGDFLENCELGDVWKTNSEKIECVDVQEDGLNEAYGDKRDFKKIEIFVKGKYVGTTTWAKGLKQAKEKFLEKNSNVKPEDVVVKFAELN